MNKKTGIALVAVLSLAVFAPARVPQAETGLTTRENRSGGVRKLSGRKITIRTGDRSFTVDLYDNPTVDDLLSRLPLTVKANDYPGYDEKVIRLRDPLSMKGAPPGDEPEIPEVGYYGPGRWIALYYGHIGYWPGKVPVGRIHATVSELGSIPDDASATIERVKE